MEATADISAIQEGTTSLSFQTSLSTVLFPAENTANSEEVKQQSAITNSDTEIHFFYQNEEIFLNFYL